MTRRLNSCFLCFAILHAESTYGVKTRCIAVDFSTGYQIYEKIARELSDIQEIAVLGIADITVYM